MNKILFLIVLGLLALAGGFYYSFTQVSEEASDKIQIIQIWELPRELVEVSGIAYLEDDLIACVQDEDGIIFIYDLSKSAITEKIDFAGPGDYEGITVVENTAFVLRSDGAIFEVRDFQNENKSVIEHTDLFEAGLNFEGLGYDKDNNQLLLALKERSGDEYQPVYGFDLNTEKRIEEPVIKVHFNDPVIRALGKKISHKTLRPSEITIHPQTGDIYILEGVDPKLLILDPEGKPREILRLNKKQFPQAEGLTFGNSAELFISNEGKRGKANIMKIAIEE